jgi:carboxylate-amine ligase
VPPALESWEAYADALAWGAASGAFPDPSAWWYELRLHPGFGTLELRVPDGQATVGDAAAIAAVAQALMAWLGERPAGGARSAGGGRTAPAAPTWRIEQNRWSACRYGVGGDMADLETGTTRPTRDCLRALLDTLEPVATQLGAGSALERARELVEINGAIAQRRVAQRTGISSVAGWLASRFLEPWQG